MTCWKTRCATVALLLMVAGCSGMPEITPTGVPQRWYTAVADAIADQPGVGAMALLDNGGPCALRDTITVDGEAVTTVSDHGVVRLNGDIPAVSCSWYDGTPAEIIVAHADDDAGYAELVAGTAAVPQSANVQTGQEVVVGARTMQVVRTEHATNPAAGTDFEAFYLDPQSRGRVSLLVNDSDQRSADYDEQAVAVDLARFLTG